MPIWWYYVRTSFGVTEIVAHELLPRKSYDFCFYFVDPRFGCNIIQTSIHKRSENSASCDEENLDQKRIDHVQNSDVAYSQLKWPWISCNRKHLFIYNQIPDRYPLLTIRTSKFNASMHALIHYCNALIAHTDKHSYALPIQCRGKND